MDIIQKCRICGCTENKIKQSCVETIIFHGEQWFSGCHWVETNLCSGCVEK